MSSKKMPENTLQTKNLHCRRNLDVMHFRERAQTAALVHDLEIVVITQCLSDRHRFALSLFTSPLLCSLVRLMLLASPSRRFLSFIFDV
mmetsp:Transcript_9567/g.13656  ORF Transcript_9567/g.13656 Transcript_9567/m.13656 type:complete len:89 (+) Transcript_9567:436-702(+)